MLGINKMPLNATKASSNDTRVVPTSILDRKASGWTYNLQIKSDAKDNYLIQEYWLRDHWIKKGNF